MMVVKEKKTDDNIKFLVFNINIIYKAEKSFGIFSTTYLDTQEKSEMFHHEYKILLKHLAV